MKTLIERSVMAVVFAVVVATFYLGLERPFLITQTLNPVAVGHAAVTVHVLPDVAPPADVAEAVVKAPLMLPPRRPRLEPTPERSVTALEDWFEQLNYDLDHIRDGAASVPHAFLATLPPDLKDVPETAQRKRLFFQALLPLVLRANQEILADRRRLWQVRSDLRLGRRLTPGDRLWLNVLSDRYKVDSGDVDALLRRVDIIPPSLALAQAAEESGWGTSRFARVGNAVFGQYTTTEERGLVPKRRDEDKDHLVRKFDQLIDSVRAYMRNLNTHKAYADLRKARSDLRRSGEPLDGLSLARFLDSYSARGDDYVVTIRAMIRANDLNRLDDARLMRVVRPEA